MIRGLCKTRAFGHPEPFGKRNFETAAPTGRDEGFYISITQILSKRKVLQSSLKISS